MGEAYVNPEYPRSEVTGRIIAAAMQVHRGLGPGFQEVIYQRALALELPAHGLGTAGRCGLMCCTGTYGWDASGLISSSRR